MSTVKWILISEQLPPLGLGILITNGVMVTAAERRTIFPEGKWYFDGCEFGGYEWDFNFSDNEITHWAVLPEPPVIDWP